MPRLPRNSTPPELQPSIAGMAHTAKTEHKTCYFHLDPTPSLFVLTSYSLIILCYTLLPPCTPYTCYSICNKSARLTICTETSLCVLKRCRVPDSRLRAEGIGMWVHGCSYESGCGVMQTWYLYSAVFCTAASKSKYKAWSRWNSATSWSFKEDIRPILLIMRAPRCWIRSAICAASVRQACQDNATHRAHVICPLHFHLPWQFCTKQKGTVRRMHVARVCAQRDNDWTREHGPARARSGLALVALVVRRLGQAAEHDGAVRDVRGQDSHVVAARDSRVKRGRMQE